MAGVRSVDYIPQDLIYPHLAENQQEVNYINE